MAIIECVPNISEGRDRAAITAIADAVRAVPGVRVLDVQSDAAHNRSVLTLAGAAAPLGEAILTLFEHTLKTATIPTYYGISIAIPRYIAMQLSSSSYT
jgi:glutamate formiminotransferase